MKPGGHATVKSAQRALDLLEALASEDEPLGFLALSKRLGVPKSSLFHLMGHLIARGYVEQVEPGPRYRTGQKLLEVAAAAEKPKWLPNVVRPVIRQLCEETAESAAFYVPENSMLRGVIVEDGPHALSYRMPPDVLAPLHAFSAGKAALACLDDAALEDYLAQAPREPFTPNTIVEADALRREIGRIRARGLGTSRSEYAVGVAGFAMPVRRAGDLVGVINVSVPEARLSDPLIERVVRCLTAAVSSLEDRLRTKPKAVA